MAIGVSLTTTGKAIMFTATVMMIGIMKFESASVACPAITDIPLMTVEGAEDDMCQVGMTAAAHDLCTSLGDLQRRRYVQPGVGHYGVFSGSRYSAEVAPRIKDFIAAHL